MTYGISPVLSFLYLGLIFQLVTFQLLLLILLGLETYYSHKQSNYPYSPELHSRVLWTILCYPSFAPDMQYSENATSPFKSKLRYLYSAQFIKLLSTSDFN